MNMWYSNVNTSSSKYDLFLARMFCKKKSFYLNENVYTVKPVYKDHPREPKIVVFVDWWSLFRGSLVLELWKTALQIIGRCRQVVIIRRWSLAQV